MLSGRPSGDRAGYPCLGLVGNWQRRTERPPRGRRLIACYRVGGQIAVSAISAWEVAMLVGRERLALAMYVDTWLATIADIDAVSFVPVDTEIATKSVHLPGTFPRFQRVA